MSSPAQPIMNWAQWLPNSVNALENGVNRAIPDSVLQYLHLMPQANPQPAGNILAPLQHAAQVANEYASQRLSSATAKQIRERAAQLLGGL